MPEDPQACAEAVEAIRAAEWVVLGPGSWFTSVIPHLMVPGLRRALAETEGRLVVVLNLEAQAGETTGFGPADHLAALFEHAPDLTVHAVLVDASSLADDRERLEKAVADPGRPAGRRGHRRAGRAAARSRPPGRRLRPDRRRGVRPTSTARLSRRMPTSVVDPHGRIPPMAMTAQVKAELASTQITKTCCRKAEVASMLRFAGGLHIVSGRIVVEAELDTGAAARRLRTDISEVYGHPSDVVMVQGNGIRKGSRYIVRVTKDGEALARQTGPARPARSPRTRPAARRRQRRRL